LTNCQLRVLRMSVEELTAQLATAKKAHKADKADAGLKSAYKAAKTALAAGVAAAEAKAAKKAAKKAKKASKRKAEAPAEKAEEPAKKQKTDPQATLKEAKAAYKANKGDAALKAAYKAAKKAAEAAPVAEETPEEAPVDDLMASLKKKKTEVPAIGNAGLSGPPPSADHEGNPPCEKIFAGNLSFDIDDDAAKEWFKECGAITDIHWLEDRDSGKFKGCGFITFESVEAAAKAVAKNGEDCMGREIRLNYAKPRAAGGGKGGKGGGKSRPLSEKPEGCTTVFAGNLSFDIDDDKMREFASDCGEVKSIRWLTDRDSGDFKGCGFIEFFDGAGVDEFVKKNGSSLLGRDIRLDYAAPRAPR